MAQEEKTRTRTGVEIYIIPDDNPLAIVAFDNVNSISHDATAEVAEHPVEKGSNIADHVRPLPRMLTIEWYITNTPIIDIGRGGVSPATLRAPVYNPPGFLEQPTPGALFRLGNEAHPVNVTVNVLQFPDPFDRIRETHSILEDLRARKQSVSVVTDVETYTDMAITSVSLPRKERGGATFTLIFKQITVVSNATVAAPKPATKRGAPGVANGGQSGKGMEAVNNTKASVLKSGLTKLFQPPS